VLTNIDHGHSALTVPILYKSTQGGQIGIDHPTGTYTCTQETLEFGILDAYKRFLSKFDGKVDWFWDIYMHPGK
jgi:hypothetical protein